MTPQPHQESMTPGQAELIRSNPALQILINKFDMVIVPSEQTLHNNAIKYIVHKQHSQLSQKHEK